MSDTEPRSTLMLHPLLLNTIGWFGFGVALFIGALESRPWRVILVTLPAYVGIGFTVSLMLALLYQRLDVGQRSFGRSLAIIIVASYLGGLAWAAPYYFYRAHLAGFVHLFLVGDSGQAYALRGTVTSGFLFNTALPLFGWSLVRLGRQYSAALREQQAQALRAVAAARDAQLRMLAYQLNPHFLFNALNSIRALVDEDRQRARGMVTALAEYLRYALVERPMHVALLEEEAASVQGYLEIERVRFEERLDAQMDIEPAALRCEVPAFLLNPLVENAVKHGAGAAGTPLVLRIEARLVAPDRLRVVVENSGRWERGEARLLGSQAAEVGPAGGVGLANVRARLAALHPDDHRIEIEEADGRVRVVIELPARLRSLPQT
jgi:two-component system LytT family sensor kinase